MSPTDRRRDVLDSLGRAIVTGEMTPGQSLTLEASPEPWRATASTPWSPSALSPRDVGWALWSYHASTGRLWRLSSCAGSSRPIHTAPRSEP